MSASCAPIALFVFNRPHHVRETLRSLMANAEFAHSTLHVFCDGPRNEGDVPGVMAAREAVRELGLSNAIMHEHASNQGLAKSIADGVTQVCADAGRVIVMEDDLLVSRSFLAYMNSALHRYAEIPEAMQVTGHCVSAPGYEGSRGSSFLPFTSSLGWATWKRAWAAYDPSMPGYEEMLGDRVRRDSFNLEGAFSYTRMVERLRRANRLQNSWAIRWYWSVFCQNGLVLFPHSSLVFHIGDDGTGTNVAAMRRPRDEGFAEENAVDNFPAYVRLDEEFYRAIQSTLRRQHSPWSKLGRLVKSFMSRPAERTPRDQVARRT